MRSSSARSSPSSAPPPPTPSAPCGSWTRASPFCRRRRSARPRPSARTGSPRWSSATKRTRPSPRSSRRSRTRSRAAFPTCASCAGHFQSDGTYWNSGKSVPERFSGLFLPQGKEHVSVAEAKAGDIVAVAKLKETLTGDTLTAKDHPVVIPALKVPEASIAYAIEPKAKGDEDKISTALHKLIEEDPSLSFQRDEETKEFHLAGASQLHVEIAVARLKKRYGVEVILHPPKVPYRETITRKAEAHGRHKKQTGGHGQFADCRIRVEPLPRGKDFEFVDDIYGGAIPRNFIPAVEKGIQEVRRKGFLAGYPMVDFRVTLYDGQYHDVDSSELAFKLAGALAYKEAMAAARPTLLEPVMNVEITAPNEYVGDLMGDLSSRRGKVEGMDAADDDTVIKAQVPMSELLTYGAQLRSITQGRGSFHLEFSHYAEVPHALQEKVDRAVQGRQGRRGEGSLGAGGGSRTAEPSRHRRSGDGHAGPRFTDSERPPALRPSFSRKRSAASGPKVPAA